MKKLLLAVLTLTMAFSLSMVAFAEEGNNTVAELTPQPPTGKPQV